MNLFEDEEDDFLRGLNAKHDSGSVYQKSGHKPVSVKHEKNGMYYAWRGEGKDRVNVGTASLSHKGHLISVSTHPEHRRSGVATALYNHIEKHSGIKLKPSPTYQSKDAKEFWSNRNKMNENKIKSFKEFISEDEGGSPPTNNLGSANIAGVGIPKEGDPNFAEPGVPPKKLKKIPFVDDPPVSPKLFADKIFKRTPKK